MRELNLLNVAEDVLYRPFNTLSHGEQTKVLLAARFLKENSFLLIDEPTNHLDMNARKLVSDYLKSKRGYILVSHDRAFLDNCIDHILSINKANIEIQKGNLTSWWENKARQDVYFIFGTKFRELRVSLRAFFEQRKPNFSSFYHHYYANNYFACNHGCYNHMGFFCRQS